MSKKYTIRTIGDIVRLPADRLNDFLDEMKHAIPFVREQQKLMEMVMEDVSRLPQELTAIEEITWTDDGKRGVYSVISDAEGRPIFDVTIKKGKQ